MKDVPDNEQTDKSPPKRLRLRVNSPYRRRGQRCWTQAQRVAQASAIRRHKPWLKSTGPRSISGRARCSGNAIRHGMRSTAMRELGRALLRQKMTVRAKVKAAEICGFKTGWGIPAFHAYTCGSFFIL